VECQPLTVSQPKGELHVRYLDQFEPGKAFAENITALSGISRYLPNKPFLIVDQTAVGSQLVAELRKRKQFACVFPLIITGGNALTENENGTQVLPRKELVTVLQLGFQERRIKIASKLPKCPTLERELAEFRMRPVPLDAPDYWRGGRHDDMVLAVAIAVWYADRFLTKPKGVPYVISHGAGTSRRWRHW
jgi:hypothetical protein